MLAVLLALIFVAQAWAWPAVNTLAGAPTMGTCGTSPSVSGTDGHGAITVGTGVVLSCALNFSATLGAAPKCMASSSLSAVTVGITSITTAAVTFGMSATLGGGTLYYECWP